MGVMGGMSATAGTRPLGTDVIGRGISHHLTGWQTIGRFGLLRGNVKGKTSDF